jgi:putative ABC transport system substrate-binding protein
MDRRTFVRRTALGFVAMAFTIRAQQQPKIAHICYLLTASLATPEARALLNAFLQGLREHGYLEGRNVAIEVRTADGKVERFPCLAAELVRLQVDLIVAGNTPAARAAQQATSTILSSRPSWVFLSQTVLWPACATTL